MPCIVLVRDLPSGIGDSKEFCRGIAGLLEFDLAYDVLIFPRHLKVAQLLHGCVVLFELFCGRLPFTGESPLQIVVHHMQTPPPKPRSIKPNLPEDLQAVILKCLEKDRDKRFQTVEDLTDALNAISERQAA